VTVLRFSPYVILFIILNDTRPKENLMKKLVSLISLISALAFTTTPAEARWAVDYDETSTVARMIEDDLLQVRADNYFLITADEITSTPQMSLQTDRPGPKAQYAVIVGGVVDKIVTWDGYTPNRKIDAYGIIVKLPSSKGVKYIDERGVTRFKPITQGSIISIIEAPGFTITPTLVDINTVPVATLADEPVDAAVAESNTAVVVLQTVAVNNSVSLSIQVPDAASLPSTSSVSVYVVTDGRSTTAIGLAQSQTAVTVTDIPQGQNVTVKTVIHDSVTNTETVISNPVIATIPVEVPVPTPARDASLDLATIAAPVTQAVTTDSSGARQATISIPAVTNFDGSKTWATLMVVDKKTGSTTAIGTDGSAQTIDVNSLGSNNEYLVKLVLRDLATGQETTIYGETITK
jgi:hypothetical protein